jgi:hypothetical protein
MGIYGPPEMVSEVLALENLRRRSPLTDRLGVVVRLAVVPVDLVEGVMDRSGSISA